MADTNDVLDLLAEAAEIAVELGRSHEWFMAQAATSYEQAEGA